MTGTPGPCVSRTGIVGHVPRQWGTYMVHGWISCGVTGKQKIGVGLEVSCISKFTGQEKMIMKIKEKMEHKTKMGTHSKPLLHL